MDIQNKQFQGINSKPVEDRAFTPLQPGEPTKYDPSGQEHTYSDVPWRVGARNLGRLHHNEHLGDTYIRGGASQSRGGYVRRAMNSTLGD